MDSLVAVKFFPIRLDTSRLTVLYFCLSALDLLDALPAVVSPTRRAAIIQWVYSLQVLPSPDDTEPYVHCGFRGSPNLGVAFTAQGTPPIHPTDEAHITMTYTALCVLAILGDDWSGVNRPAIIGALRHLQRPDGSFSSVSLGGEADMRFLFCAYVLHLCEHARRVQPLPPWL